MAQDQIEQQDDPNLFLDLVAAPFRGFEGAAQGLYGVGDFLLGDTLPDWDTRLLGRSETLAGGLTEGMTQFLLGFIPIAGQVSKAGTALSQVAKAGSVGQKLAQSRVAQAAVAGMAADFTVFTEQELRLSNFLQQYPGLHQPVAEFLATKDDDTFLEGRLKNAVEGLGLGLMVEGVVRGVKAIKNGRRVRDSGGSPEDVINSMREGLGDDAGEVIDNAVNSTRREQTLPADLDDAVRQWDLQNKNYRSDEWFEGGRVDSVGAFDDAVLAGGDKLQAHGMAKESTLTGATKNLLNIIRNGLDPDRRGGVLDTAPLAAKTENKSAGGALGTAGGESYRDGPYILVAKEGMGLEGNLDGLGAVLVNPKHADIVTGLRLAIHETRPDIIVDSFSNAKGVTEKLLISDAAGAAGARVDPDPTTSKDDLPQPKDENEINVDFEDGKSVDLKDPQKTKKIKDDAKALLSRMLGDDFGSNIPEDILGGDKVKDFVPDNVGLYDGDKEVVALLKEVKIEFDKVKKVSPEIRSEQIRRIKAGEGKQVLEESLEHLPKGIRDDYLLGMADDAIDDIGRHLDFADIFRTIYAEKVRALRTVYYNSGLTTIERKGNVQAYLDTIWQYMSREQQLARRMGQGLRDVQTFRLGKLRKNPVHELQAGGRDFAEQFTRDRKQKWIDQVVAILESGGSDKAILKKVLNITKNSQAGKLDMLREFWLNNLLSGLPTQSVNGMGGALTTFMRGFEMSIGSLMSGRPDLAKAVIKHAVELDTYSEVFRYSIQAAKKGEPILLPSSRPLEMRGNKAITSENIGINPDSEFYDTFNKIAEALRLPSRGLVATDEFFKGLNVRLAVKYKATIEAIENGITDTQGIAKYVNEKLEKIITQGGELYSQRTVAREGFMKARQRELSDEATIKYVKKYVKENFDENASALAKYGKDAAEEVTHTRELDPNTLSGSFHKTVTSNPILSFVFPFVRTPVNILTYALDRSLFGVVNPKNIRPLLQNLRSANPAVRAAAWGKATVTGMAVATHIAAFQSFSNRISGGGPRDPKARKRLEDAGWQPYSIRVGNKWISYRRLDPLATIIGVYADMMDMLKENWEANKSVIERTTLTLLVSLIRNMTNKSYLAGMEQFTEAMSDESGRAAERFLGNIAVNSTIPLAGLWRTTGKEIVGDIMSMDDMKEIRNFVDRFRLYSPTGSGMRLDPRRNILGEEKEIEDSFGIPLLGAISPIATRTQKDDLVLEEIAALDHGFSNPSPSYRGLIDLTGYENNKGQSAHDRRLELMGTVQIGGKTLRQALEKLIKSREYQQMSPSSEPGLPSPRIRMINSILSRYRAEGLSRALKEYPELNDFHRQYKEVQRQQRQGAELDNLIQTLNF